MTAVERKKANDLHVNVEKVVKREKKWFVRRSSNSNTTIDQNWAQIDKMQKMCFFLAT